MYEITRGRTQSGAGHEMLQKKTPKRLISLSR
jgi:hypothetical protein